MGCPRAEASPRVRAASRTLPRWFAADLRAMRVLPAEPTVSECADAAAERADAAAVDGARQFRPEVSQDLLRFVHAAGWTGNKLETTCRFKSIPAWGTVTIGTSLEIEKAKPPSFGKPRNIDFEVLPDPLPPRAKIRHRQKTDHRKTIWHTPQVFVYPQSEQSSDSARHAGCARHNLFQQAVQVAWDRCKSMSVRWSPGSWACFSPMARRIFVDRQKIAAKWP